MSTQAAISVVLPVYNAERFLADAVDSVLAQTFGDFELIAVDDGSTDGSLDMLQAYARKDPRVRVITRPNTGISRALNDGIGQAGGEFVARMDADDIALPARFLRQIDFLRARPEIGAVGAAYQAINEIGTYIGRPTMHPCEPMRIRKALRRGECPMVHPAVIMRRDAVTRAGGYRRIFDSCEDYDLWLRISDFTDLANLPDVLLLHRLHGESVSAKRAVQQALGVEVARRVGLARRQGKDDPIREADTITSALLDRVGISPAHVELLRGRTLRSMASNQLSSGGPSAAMAVIAEYENAEIPSWVRRRLGAEFEFLHARIRKTQGHPRAVVSGTLRICLRHPYFAVELMGKALRRFRR